MKKRRIAVLHHEREIRVARDYMVRHYSMFWREDGHEVIHLFGVERTVPADLLILHVDLSVVPDEYLEFSRRYPLVINGSVKDIRKRGYTSLQIVRGDGYAGQAIVKSNFNFAAVPERSIGLRKPKATGHEFAFASPADYRVYEHPDLVPPAAFDDPDLVVEKFQPEIENGLYHVRLQVFLGSRMICTRLASPHPIVNGASKVHAESVTPDPRVLEIARARGFEYGKFDYVLHEGEPLVLDMNKTVGGPPPTTDALILAGRRYCAEGLYDWFD